MLRAAGDRANGQRMIAAHHHRELTRLQAFAEGVASRGAPRYDLVEMTVSVDRIGGRIARARQIALVDNRVPEPPQSDCDTGDAQRLWPHGGAGTGATNVGRHADERDLQWLCHERFLAV